MISSDSVSDVFVQALANTLRRPLVGEPLIQVTEILRPVVDGCVNENEAFRKKLGSFVFPDGRTGEWWIQNRLKAVFDEKGEYWNRLHRDGGFDYIVSALYQMKKGFFPRWNTNRLIISLFDSSLDLHKSRMPTPPCLITLAFHPVRDTLDLIGTFRAQYTDAKGYGNMLSLCHMLRHVCDRTEFHPNRVYNIAHNPILKYPKSTARKLLYTLREVEL